MEHYGQLITKIRFIEVNRTGINGFLEISILHTLNSTILHHAQASAGVVTTTVLPNMDISELLRISAMV